MARTLTIVEVTEAARGVPGPASTEPGPPGPPGSDSVVPGPPGDPGPAGLSAYQVAVANGFVGTQAAWLASLEGDPGPPGADSTVPGPAGLSAYQVAVANGFVGTQAEWLASLQGEDGAGATPIVPENITADHVIADDNSHILLVDATANDVQITLPAALDNTGRLDIRRVDESIFDVTIIPAGTDSVDGDTDAILFPSESMTFSSNQTDTWWQL